MWSAIPLAFVLALGGTSLVAAPAANAAGGGMISVTFDDGWTSQYNNALPILNKYGVPATMYIISGSVNAVPDYMTQAQIQAFASRGDQIAAHTVTHADLTTLTAAQVNTELSQSKATLQGMFGASAAVDFASPYGAYNATTTAAVKSLYSSQRNTDGGYNAAAGFDPYNILVQNVDSTTTPAIVQGWITEAKASGTWLVLVYHEVGANIGADIYHTDTAVLDAHMAAVKNSGLPMVTIRQGVEAMTSTTTGPPAAATSAINALAAATPRLGAPSGNITCGLVSGGCYRLYQGGAINWSPATGAHYSLGAIRQTWAATNYERGRLGYPTTDEVGGLVNGGVYQLYQGGAINWSPASGAHYSLGAIRQTWAATNFERGRLGYPTTDEIGGLINGGVYQLYQGGAINWSPASGAHYSLGAIRQAWATTGYERGRLGYPVTDEFASGNGVAQDYQGGRISWAATGGAVVSYR
ncbi:polysaccharide deacetylase family protein [Pseudarthrobacter sp. TAF60_1]|uniref:polysaccharide deacetylase family protein n=1 Tax=Pseudarthrobacter sp. TAF60_1 TaxID=3233071 RepID=UPI003F9B83DE